MPAAQLAALVLSFAPALAWALPLSEYHARIGDTLDLFVSGSSAQDNALERLFRLVCEPKTLDVYRGDAVRLFFCRTKTGAGGLPGNTAGQKVALNKSSTGGSGGGVGPLIQRTALNFFNVMDVRAQFEQRCPPDKRTQHPAEGAQIAYVEYECLNSKPYREIPDAGISDVEPSFFLNAYHLSPDAIDVLSAHSANALIMGIPITVKLRDALQSARFAKDDPCNPGNPRYQELVEVNHGVRVKRGETEACMPSLTRAQLAGMFSGMLSTWGQIVNPQGYPLAAKTRDKDVISPPGVHPPSDDRVYICRRVPTSGTQAAFEMFFLNQRCAKGVPPFVDSGDTVFQGAVTGDVQSCLTQLDAQNEWAVGILATEIVETPDERWRFIKMDGVAPTLLNAFNGRWPLFVEQSYQWRNEHSDQPLTGLRLELMTQIGLQLGNPSIIRDLDRSSRHAWGHAGLLALPTEGVNTPTLPMPGKPVDQAALDDNPVLAVRHQTSNCSAVVPQYPTALP